MTANRICMSTTSSSSVTLLLLSVAVLDYCCGLGVPLPPNFARIWTKQKQQLGLLASPGSSSISRQHNRSNLGGGTLVLKTDDGPSPFRPKFPVDGDSSGEIGGSAVVASEANRVPVPAQSTMFWNLDGRPIDSRPDRKRARDGGAFLLTPELTGEKVSTRQRRRSPGHPSDGVQQGSVRREELSARTMDDGENGGGIRNGDVLSMKEFDDEPSIQKDLERKGDNGYERNGIGAEDVAYHDDDNADDSMTTDSILSRLEPESEERQNTDVSVKGSIEDTFPNRAQRWSTDAVRVWGKKRAWEMDPVRVWGKRKWEMDPVRVWGKRAWEMDPVRVWGKRGAWEMDPVRVWGKRAWGGSDPGRVLVKRAWDNDSVRVWGKREWETDPVRVWGK